MIYTIKKKLYFVVALYFAFFAKIVLLRWKPRVIAVTGSSGKTTTLHLIASQLGKLAKYSFHANSTYGIPFDILGLHRRDLTLIEWPLLFISAPFSIFRSLPKEKIYIVEVDCDRPKEGVFLGKLLKPEVTIWLSLSRTHSMNFQGLIEKGSFKSLEGAISHEFGNLLKYTQKYAVINSDSKHIANQIKRTKAKVERLSLKNIPTSYKVDYEGTKFKLDKETYKFSYLLPQKTVYSILSIEKLQGYLGLSKKITFSNFEMPPGRSSIFKGIKGITMIDSTYNANTESMSEVIKMFNNIKVGNPKWLVLGDMIEQGKNTKREHNKLAKLIAITNYDKIILMGPRISEFTSKELNKLNINNTAFERPDKTLDYLLKNIKGGELILFKGARFLEGVIEALLKNKSEAKKLARREKIWNKRRAKFGL